MEIESNLQKINILAVDSILFMTIIPLHVHVSTVGAPLHYMTTFYMHKIGNCMQYLLEAFIELILM